MQKFESDPKARKAELERKRMLLKELKIRNSRDRESKSRINAKLRKKTTPIKDIQNVDRLFAEFGIDKNEAKKLQAKAVDADTKEKDNILSAERIEETFVRKYNLSISSIESVDFPPFERHFYSKFSQTNESVTDSDSSSDEELEKPKSFNFKTDLKRTISRQENVVLNPMSKFEKKVILKSEEFQAFFENAARCVERELCEKDAQLNEADLSYKELDDSNLQIQRELINNSFKDRMVMSLDWNSKFSGQVLAAYGSRNETPTHDENGTACIWNLSFCKETPDQKFSFNSPVTKACFARGNPNIIVGATYCGKIVLWDKRCFRKTPVKKTHVSIDSHSHPIYCMDFIGNSYINTVVTISTDGKLCTWNLEMLNNPLETYNIASRIPHTSLLSGVTAFSISPVNPDKFVIGTEEGVIYSGSNFHTKDQFQVQHRHFGPVTSLNFNSYFSSIDPDISNLYLSTSFDWTTKIWSFKNKKFSYSFEDSTDYVFDGSWSPTNSSVFSKVDVTGKVAIWNLNESHEQPVVSQSCSSNGINCCRWESSGQTLAIGDSQGSVCILSIPESISSFKQADGQLLMEQIKELEMINDAENWAE